MVSSCADKGQTKNKHTEIRIQRIEKNIQLDSIYVDSILNLQVVNKIVSINKSKYVLPFNYLFDGRASTYLFQWNLCDLMIDSDSSNYSHFSFSNNIPYKGYIGFNGKVHVVKTKDSFAITTEKFRKLHKENYQHIYYFDKESVIYKIRDNRIGVLFYRYLKNKKAYFIYYKENDDLGINATEQELLDLSLNHLRMAKNMLSKEKSKPIKTQNWKTYNNSLSSLEKKVYGKIYKQIFTSIDTLEFKKVYTPKTDGNYLLVSIIKLDEKGNEMWKKINKITYKKGVDFEKEYGTKLSNQIAFLRSKGNTLKLEYSDDSSIILKKDYGSPEYIDYAVFSKTVLKNSPVLIFTGGWQNYGEVDSKEMAYFYLNLFKNFGNQSN